MIPLIRELKVLQPMRRSVRSILTLLAICCLSPLAHAVDIYVLTNDTQFAGAGSTDFGRIDTATGDYTSIASLSGDVWNLAWNATAGNFFVTTGAQSNTELRTLTTSGTLSASLGTIGRTIYGTAYRTADSTLYAYSYTGNSTGTINTANGSFTVLNVASGVSSVPPTGGRYSIMNDTMYFAGSFIDLARFGTMGYTSTSTFQSIGSNALYAYTALANDGTTMYGIYGNGLANQQQLYAIDTATGGMTPGPLIKGTRLGTYFHGAAIVPVPEPSTYALGMIATGVMGFVARRRKARRA